MTTRYVAIDASVRAHARNRAKRQSVLPQESARQSLRNSAMVPPQHVIRHGYPVFPKFLVESVSALTADGSYVPELTYPWEISFQDAHTRFIAQENTFDDTANIWNPFFSSGVDYYFTWSGLIEPRLEEIEYLIGKMIYRVNSIRIEEAAALVSSFNSGMDDAASFMIAMAGVINSSDTASLIRVGDTMGDSIEVSVDEFFSIRNQYGTAVLKPTMHPAKMIPFYMVLMNDPSRTEIYVATGTSRMYKATIPNQDATRSLQVFIGEDISGNKTLDLNLFELTLFPYAYGGPMTPTQIINEMADAYGSRA